MKCDICGAAADVHVCDVQTDGTPSERHLCQTHASASGFPVAANERIALSMVSRLRAMAEFMRSTGRAPGRDEMEPFGASSDLSDSEPGSQAFNEQLTYLVGLANFIEKYGRLPTEGEMPDPF